MMYTSTGFSNCRMLNLYKTSKFSEGYGTRDTSAGTPCHSRLLSHLRSVVVKTHFIIQVGILFQVLKRQRGESTVSFSYISAE